MSVQAKTGESEASGADQGSIKSSLQSSSDSGGGNGLRVCDINILFIHTFRPWGRGLNPLLIMNHPQW